MKEFYLYPKDDKSKFFEICHLFEQTYPQFEKEDLFVDPLDDHLLQAYHYRNNHAVIKLDRLWYREIILSANFDPISFLDILGLAK